MMSIEQENIIDIVSFNKSGDVVLTISDHLDWEGDIHEHLFLLQEKLNAYLRFVESGEILEKYPKSEGRKVIFETVMKYPPTAEAEEHCQKFREVIEDAGIGFRIRELMD